MDANWDLQVTGVYQDLPSNSDFKEASFIAPLDRYISGWLTLDNWDNQNMQVYVQLHSKADLSSVSAAIKNIMKPFSNGIRNEVFLHPMSKWHLHSQFKNGVEVTSDRLKYVWLYAIIGLLVLLLACINFINLSTARSEKSIKQIGVQKVIGASRKHLAFNFIGESFSVTILSFLLAMATASLMKPWFGEMTGKNLVFPVENQVFWLCCFLIIVTTALLTGDIRHSIYRRSIL